MFRALVVVAMLYAGAAATQPSPRQRAHDLLGNMTLSEKLSMLAGVPGEYTVSFPTSVDDVAPATSIVDYLVFLFGESTRNNRKRHRDMLL
jgi:hypothetical protein